METNARIQFECFCFVLFCFLQINARGWDEGSYFLPLITSSKMRLNFFARLFSWILWQLWVKHSNLCCCWQTCSKMQQLESSDFFFFLNQKTGENLTSWLKLLKIASPISSSVFIMDLLHLLVIRRPRRYDCTNNYDFTFMTTLDQNDKWLQTR